MPITSLTTEFCSTAEESENWSALPSVLEEIYNILTVQTGDRLRGVAINNWVNSSTDPTVLVAPDSTELPPEVSVLLPRLGAGDPNVRAGDPVFFYQYGLAYYAAPPYMDEKIGSVKLWSLASGNIPGGWAMMDGVSNASGGSDPGPTGVNFVDHLVYLSDEAHLFSSYEETSETLILFPFDWATVTAEIDMSAGDLSVITEYYKFAGTDAVFRPGAPNGFSTVEIPSPTLAGTLVSESETILPDGGRTQTSVSVPQVFVRSGLPSEVADPPDVPPFERVIHAPTLTNSGHFHDMVVVDHSHTIAPHSHDWTFDHTHDVISAVTGSSDNGGLDLSNGEIGSTIFEDEPRHQHVVTPHSHPLDIDPHFHNAFIPHSHYPGVPPTTSMIFIERIE